MKKKEKLTIPELTQKMLSLPVKERGWYAHQIRILQSKQIKDSKKKA